MRTAVSRALSRGHAPEQAGGRRWRPRVHSQARATRLARPSAVSTRRGPGREPGGSAGPGRAPSDERQRHAHQQFAGPGVGAVVGEAVVARSGRWTTTPGRTIRARPRPTTAAPQRRRPPTERHQPHERQGEQQVELLLDGQRPQVDQRRGRSEQRAVVRAGCSQPPVGHVAERREHVAPEPGPGTDAPAGLEDHDRGQRHQGGGQQPAGPPLPEPGPRQPARAGPLVERQRGDEEPGQGEEGRHAEVATPGLRRSRGGRRCTASSATPGRRRGRRSSRSPTVRRPCAASRTLRCPSSPDESSRVGVATPMSPAPDTPCRPDSRELPAEGRALPTDVRGRWSGRAHGGVDRGRRRGRPARPRVDGHRGGVGPAGPPVRWRRAAPAPRRDAQHSNSSGTSQTAAPGRRPR